MHTLPNIWYCLAHGQGHPIKEDGHINDFLKLAIISLEVCRSEWSFFFPSVWLCSNTHSRVYAISSKIFAIGLSKCIFFRCQGNIYNILIFNLIFNLVSALFQLPINIFS